MPDITLYRDDVERIRLYLYRYSRIDKDVLRIRDLLFDRLTQGLHPFRTPKDDIRNDEVQTTSTKALAPLAE